MYQRKDKTTKYFHRRKRNNKLVFDFKSYKRIHHTVYDQNDITKILLNTTLKQVIGDYINLREKGKLLYVGRCPFCKTLTRNDSHFVISDVRHRYKCFECGIGGIYAVSFLMRYHEIPFSNAISHINYHYHKNKFELKIIKKTVVTKGMDRTDEDWPF